jgi:hypothetical protein
LPYIVTVEPGLHPTTRPAVALGGEGQGKPYTTIELGNRID